jgi:hypothetical protein
LSAKLESLPKEELDKIVSEEERKAIYNFVQLSRILALVTFFFFLVIEALIGSLINPQSTLLEWAREHVYVRVGVSILLFLPTFIIFNLSFKLAPISTALHKDLSSPMISPEVFMMVVTLAFLFSLIIFGCLASFFTIFE